MLCKVYVFHFHTNLANVVPYYSREKVATVSSLSNKVATTRKFACFQSKISLWRCLLKNLPKTYRLPQYPYCLIPWNDFLHREIFSRLYRITVLYMRFDQRYRVIPIPCVSTFLIFNVYHSSPLLILYTHVEAGNSLRNPGGTPL